MEEIGAFITIRGEEKYGLYLNEVEIIEPTLNPLLEKLIKMAEDIEYMHNFQKERFDIVEYIYKTHEIMKLLKETKGGGRIK